MNRILVSFFSASGVTKRVANTIADALNCDMFEIEPEELYTNDDLNWMNKESRSSIEMNDITSRPKVKNKVLNIDDYSIVLLGFPIWWDVAPRVVNTFIEENNLLNKKVYIFATSGGSNIQNSLNDLRNTYPNINFIDAKLLNGYVSDVEIKEWISK